MQFTNWVFTGNGEIYEGFQCICENCVSYHSVPNEAKFSVTVTNYTGQVWEGAIWALEETKDRIDLALSEISRMYGESLTFSKLVRINK